MNVTVSNAVTEPGFEVRGLENAVGLVLSPLEAEGLVAGLLPLLNDQGEGE